MLPSVDVRYGKLPCRLVRGCQGRDEITHAITTFAGLKERDQMVVSLRLGCPKLTGSPEFPQVWTILGFPFEDIRFNILEDITPEP